MWYGSIRQFLNFDPEDLLNTLCSAIYKQTYAEALLRPQESSTLPQIRAWQNSIQDLKQQLRPFQDVNGYVIFEYEIPRSGGRRPDVLLLLPGEILVLEFKGYDDIKDAEKHQASLYVRDLTEYHSAVQKYDLNVRGSIVYSTNVNSDIKPDHEYQVYLTPNSRLSELINKFNHDGVCLTPEVFLQGVYQPLPSIIESARHIFHNKPLEEIRNIKSSNFDEVIHNVHAIIQQAQQTNSHHLVLISGVPGAGKTFVGLTLAYESPSAVYLSGNGPLVDVLQDALQTTTFVQALRNYKGDFKNGLPLKEHVLIFDEAQRAWDAVKMKGPYSEPDVMIQIAKQKPWSVVIGLIGEGQEIHTGEEQGIRLWNDAIAGQDFTVHAKHNQEAFPNSIKYYENPHLHLGTSLRTHNALQYFEWVEAFLKGDSDTYRAIENQLQKERFILKRMDSLEEAKQYVREVYKDSNKTYGLVTSSKNRAVQQIPFSQPRDQIKPHVAYYNDSSSQYYCKNLQYAVTEFHSQGLELDMAIIVWGDDLTWGQNGWQFNQYALNRQAENPIQMKLNAYRVLLTRGRDGVIIVKS